MLDLSDWNFDKDGNIELAGEWEFFWQQHLSKDDIDHYKGKKHYMVVPGGWHNLKIDGENLPGTGFATLRLRVDPGNYEGRLGLKLMTISSASNIFINDKLLIKTGEAGINRNTTKPAYKPVAIGFKNHDKPFDIIIQISNFHQYKGSVESLKLGSEENIIKYREHKIAIEFFLFGSILIMALYHLGFFIIRMKSVSAIYFSLFCFILAIRTAVTGEHFVNYLGNINWGLIIKIEYLTFYLGTPVFAIFTQTLFPREFSKKVLYLIFAIAGIFSIVVILSPAVFFTRFVQGYQAFTGLTGLYLMYVVILAVQRRKNGASIFLAGFIILFLSIVNDILYYNEIVFTGNLSSLGLYVFIFFQAFLISSRFSKGFYQAERLAKKLNYTNKNLSKIVEFRTSELQKQKEDLFNQKLETEKKNSDITDSINYASKIQGAVLPSDKKLHQSFFDHFIYYQPKDIVSGDFYWTRRYKNKIFVAAADCTGHGVPGAFMSLLGIAFLNEIMNFFSSRDEHIDDIRPGNILNELRKRIKEAMQQTGNIDDTHDGMDMALCMVDYLENKLIYAGANNPLYIINLKPGRPLMEESPDERKFVLSENEKASLLEIKADRMPIGFHLNEEPFTNHEFDLRDVDYLYMFSDGYTDQIGGRKNTKFRQRRFKKLLLDIAGEPMEKQKEILRSTFEKWKSPEIGQIDDILILGMRVSEESDAEAFGFFE